MFSQQNTHFISVLSYILHKWIFNAFYSEKLANIKDKLKDITY